VKEELEIERDWLLKAMPQGITFNRVIQQYYFIEDDVFKRVRESNYVNHTEYHLTIKTPREDGKIGFIEAEKLISKEVFLDKVKMAHTYITKDRFTKPYEVNGVKLLWEIDNFTSIPLIKMEIELPEDEFDLPIPDDMSQLIVIETTGMKEFSNASLSKKLVF
jgi:CYTH domain-containing protein|tara:strand:+ start:6195 stop:6683 length:489 start_codon:yes stop_codon:yes gene_type:complete